MKRPFHARNWEAAYRFLDQVDAPTPPDCPLSIAYSSFAGPYFLLGLATGFCGLYTWSFSRPHAGGLILMAIGVFVIGALDLRRKLTLTEDGIEMRGLVRETRFAYADVKDVTWTASGTHAPGIAGICVHFADGKQFFADLNPDVGRAIAAMRARTPAERCADWLEVPPRDSSTQPTESPQ